MFSDKYLECQPLKSNKELLEFRHKLVVWNNLVEPLRPRCRSRYMWKNFSEISFKENPFENFIDDDKRPEVLVCHDLAGNYRDDRFIIGSKKWDDYRFYNWSGIDYFCYFSHNYVTIPTLQWINVAHKHGVKVLGTFIVEFAEGTKILQETLQSEEFMRKIVDELVFITKYCKFEGWLINIESSINAEKIPLLRQFVEYFTQQIRQQIPGGIVIWYDSVIDTGALSWQNELNEKNRMFFEACDGIMTNYIWKEGNLQATEKLVETHYPHRMKHVFMGIDVFGRGQLAKFDTHITMAKIKNYGFSIAIFAQAWTFEGMLENGINISTATGNQECNDTFLIRNDRFFSSFWKYFFTSGPLELPFYTSFCIGSGKFKNRFGITIDRKPWINLCNQELQLSVPTDSRFITRHFDDAFDGGSCLKITSDHPRNLRLFCCDFKCGSQGIIFSYVVKKSDEHIDLELLLHFIDVQTNRHCRVICGSYELTHLPGNCYLGNVTEGNLRKCLLHIAKNGGNGKCLPGSSEINGWEIKFYYINLESSLMGHLIDIGVRLRGHSLESEWALLGAISIHEGFSDSLYDYSHIKSTDFI